MYVAQRQQHLVGAAEDRLWQLATLPVCRGACQEDCFHDDALHVAAHIADEVHANQALHEGHHCLKAQEVCIPKVITASSLQSNGHTALKIMTATKCAMSVHSTVFISTPSECEKSNLAEA